MPRRKYVRRRRINYNQIAAIIGKALEDDAWRKELLASPEKTLRTRGFEPHPEAIAFIDALRKAGFARVAKKFKPRDPPKPRVTDD